MPNFSALIALGCEIVAFDHHAACIRYQGQEFDIFVDEIPEIVAQLQAVGA